MANMTFTSTLAARRIERIQLLLRREYMTVLEIAESIYMSPVRTREYIRHLLKTNQIHVYKWDKRQTAGKSHWIAVYAWGNAKSPPKPKSKETTAERLRRRYKERKLADPEWHMQMLAKLKAKRMPIQRDWSAAWIPTKEAA